MKRLISVLLTLALMISAVSLLALTASAESEVYVKADGVAYRVQKGDTIEYVYYMSTGEKLCSLQANLTYDIDGLELVNENNLSKCFPRFAGEMYARISPPGQVNYNYSGAMGKDFPIDNCLLIRASFTVTAYYGVYEINNNLYTVAGANEHKYIYRGAVKDPLKRNESLLTGLTPYTGEIPTSFPPEPTEAPTEPTSAPTEPETDPTAPPTDPSEEPPTDPSEEPPTDPSEEPPTDPSEEPPTDPSEEPPTDPSEEPPTDPSEEPPTDPSEEPPTDPSEEPSYYILHDAATGIYLQTPFNAELIVEQIAPENYNYYIANPESIMVGKLILRRNGVDVHLDAPAPFMCPAPEGAAFYTVRHTTPSDLAAQRVDSIYRDNCIYADLPDTGVYLYSATGEAPELMLYGDADGDNELTIVDVSYIQRDLAGIIQLSDRCRGAANVDGDDAMTIIDGTYIQRWLAGIATPIDRFGYHRD